ncbi:3-deoxy-manno-octulosonate cytidylyltransferase [Thermaurantimonas aggregans]|uniref:3-deoxy-manno-octulosonate cytidylyltransferase n=1 Tax=Thermaurantimonas aggregans TaxID=2173829 RepID=A0A401XJU3_9FLAO|nr:3-deoxy-manno-octulosonate cytidylyltransferase [Thermaurantimonas aggregans]MCX8148876.1 3-deoxy-manno-octulosonate cytidylyltransferase [Thermaurantimonas aggregans]GCD77307.1 3-deoxy-manno-octulosonate cytidylyltransferase [Thermaurantimonas aggregans]
MKVLGIIPARYGSTRLPGKPLIDLGGKPMIQHVYERAIGAVDLLVVATDDERISAVVHSFGGRALMTSPEHQNGTSRCAEVLSALEMEGLSFDVVINIQGDEPLLDPLLPKNLAALFLNPSVQIATAVRQVLSASELKEGTVHVVLDQYNRALYFSRSIIPYQRDVPREQWTASFTYYHHIGIYAFRSQVLEEIVQLPSSPLEDAEKLEQLRWLAAGYRIHCIETDFQSIPVDTPEDADYVRKHLS